MQDQLLTLLSSSQQPSSPGGGGNLGNLGNLGNNLGSSPPSIFTTRQPSLLPTLSRRRTISNLFSSQQALHQARSLYLAPPQWACSPHLGLPMGRRSLPCSATSSLGRRSLLSDNLSLGTGKAGNIELNCEIEDSHHFSLRRDKTRWQ